MQPRSRVFEDRQHVLARTREQPREGQRDYEKRLGEECSGSDGVVALHSERRCCLRVWCPGVGQLQEAASAGSQPSLPAPPWVVLFRPAGGL